MKVQNAEEAVRSMQGVLAQGEQGESAPKSASWKRERARAAGGCGTRVRNEVALPKKAVRHSSAVPLASYPNPNHRLAPTLV